MTKTTGNSEDYKGADPSKSPATQQSGVFSSCSGGYPQQGAFARIPGKTLRAIGDIGGAAISMFQFGSLVVVQRFLGLEIFNLNELAPNPVDYVYDNEGFLVYDNLGIPVTQ